MNNVHGSVALQTAHKLRSAAAALLADSEVQADPRLADSLMYEAGELRARADSIEEQVKPTIAEPTEFGSIIRAGLDGVSDRVLWQRGPKGGWTSEEGAYVGSFDWLDHPEVLRIGVGEAQPLAEWETELLNTQYRRDVAVDVLTAMDVDQYLIDAVAKARPR